MNKILFFIFLFGIVGCSPKIKTAITKTYPSLPYDKEVLLLGQSEVIPATAIQIGTVKIGDTGVSVNCGWDVVVEKAKLEARKAGGNVIKIIAHTPPSIIGSSCDRITAQILLIEEDNLKLLKTSQIAPVDSTWNYAKLYIYRSTGTGFMIGYDLYLGDSVICRVKSNNKQELKIYKKGMNSLWAKTETKTEIPINIEFGQSYYLKCGIGMGVMVGRPKLELIDNKRGEIEYNNLKTK